MSKLTVTLDAPKLRNLVKTRSYQNNQGETVTVQEVKFELVPMKEQKVTYSTDKYDLVKTHFAAAIQTKEEREANAPTVFIGEAIETRWKNEQTYVATPLPSGSSKQEDPDDLPF